MLGLILAFLAGVAFGITLAVVVAYMIFREPPSSILPW